MFVGALVVIVIFLVAFSSTIPQYSRSIRDALSTDSTLKTDSTLTTTSDKEKIVRDKLPGIKCPPCVCPSTGTTSKISHDGDFYVDDVCIVDGTAKCMSTEGSLIRYTTAFDGKIEIHTTNTGSDITGVPLSVTNNYVKKLATGSDTGNENILSSNSLTYSTQNILIKNYKFTHGKHEIDINLDSYNIYSETDEENNREILTVIVNQLPIASFTNDVCIVGQSCNFDGSASSDPDGDSLIHKWTFGERANVNSNTLALYHFDSDASDSTGNYDGTVTGAVLTKGKYGNGYLFDNSNDDGITISEQIVAREQGTVEFWYYSTNSASSYIINAVDSQYDGEFSLSTLSGKVLFWLKDISIQTSDPLAANTWYHISASWGPDGQKIYVDGVLEAEDSSNTLYPRTRNVNVNIGNNPHYTVANIVKIDELVFLDYQKTDAEVLDAYCGTGEASGKIVYHTYNASGDYTITLIVDDEIENSESVTTITVVDLYNGDQSACEGAGYTWGLELFGTTGTASCCGNDVNEYYEDGINLPTVIRKDYCCASPSQCTPRTVSTVANDGNCFESGESWTGWPELVCNNGDWVIFDDDKSACESIGGMWGGSGTSYPDMFLGTAFGSENCCGDDTGEKITFVAASGYKCCYTTSCRYFDDCMDEGSVNPYSGGICNNGEWS